MLFGLFGLANAVDMEALKSRPVSKVIKLLEDMQKQLEAEAVEDKKTYDKMKVRRSWFMRKWAGEQVEEGGVGWYRRKFEISLWVGTILRGWGENVGEDCCCRMFSSLKRGRTS